MSQAILGSPVLASVGLTTSPFPTSYFRGSIPSASRLTAHTLANLRLRIEIALSPPRFSYPATALPYRDGIHTRLKTRPSPAALSL